MPAPACAEVRRVLRRRCRAHPPGRPPDRADAGRGRRPRGRGLRDGRHHRRAPRARGRDHRRPRPARARCPARHRRAPERDARLDGAARAGREAISLTGPQAGITTDGRYGRARIAGIDPTRVRAELDQGKVVIVAGFQGPADDAVSVATARPDLAERRPSVAAARHHRRRPGRRTRGRPLPIFTDVRGMYTADPRLIPTRASSTSSATRR